VKQPTSILLATAGLLLVFAGSASAQYAYIPGGAGTIWVINTVTNTVASSVDLGVDAYGGPIEAYGVAVNSAGTRVYAGSCGSNTLFVIDAASTAVIARVGVGNCPQGVAVNRAGSVVYVTNWNDNSISVVDAATNTVTATIRGLAGPRGVAVNPAGTRVYITNSGGTTVSVIDTANNTVVAQVNVGQAPYGVAVNSAGTRVYVANNAGGSVGGGVSVIDTATNTVTATVKVVGGAAEVAVNSAGTRVYATVSQGSNVFVIDTATNVVVATVTLGSGPAGVGVTPDGTRVYVTDSNGLVVIDAATNNIAGTTGIGTGPVLGQFIGGPTVPTALTINSGGIVNGASYAANTPVAPGSIASVFGTFPVSTAWPSALPLPTSLSGLSTEFEVPFAPFNKFPSPLFFVSSTQANIQIPWELAGQTSAPVLATALSPGPTFLQFAGVTASLAAFAPGVFTMNAQGQGAVVDALSGHLISPSSPATAGVTYISIYCTGLGPVTNQPATGAAASASLLSKTTTQPTVMIGGVPAGILFSGLAPAFVGLYQINVQVPAAVPPGNAVPLVISIGGATANTVTIAVQSGS
jgi:uncharacterized protein (TIGR03437 family)